MYQSLHQQFELCGSKLVLSRHIKRKQHPVLDLLQHVWLEVTLVLGVGRRKRFEGPGNLKRPVACLLNFDEDLKIDLKLTNPPHTANPDQADELIVPVPADGNDRVVRGEPVLVVHNDEEGSPTCAEVIDWKTDMFDQEELEEKISHYAPQLAAYRLAASMLLGLDVDSVTAKLVFTKTGDVIDITEKATVLTA